DTLETQIGDRDVEGSMAFISIILDKKLMQVISVQAQLAETAEIGSSVWTARSGWRGWITHFHPLVLQKRLEIGTANATEEAIVESYPFTKFGNDRRGKDKRYVSNALKQLQHAVIQRIFEIVCPIKTD